MTELAMPRLIDSAALDARNYFTSLMEQAGRRGLTGAEDRARIGAECAALLADRTAKLTQGRSSSIRTETAQELASSIHAQCGAQIPRGCRRGAVRRAA